ncbi:alpha/beta-hydrolase [Xylariaceae sp. FL0255]|nr:alpha/beta-hydrolase [Xylariaceae sp. FL0255]
MPTRIPNPEDFAHLNLKVSLVFPEVPETTTSILILFHGLGDSEASFATFAKNLNLPGVLAISVRGVSPLPPSLLGPPASDLTSPTKHFHWGDDLTLSSTGHLDPDPGFSKAENLVLEKLIKATLIGKCGWEHTDILLFGFGQGGSLALGLASNLRQAGRVIDITGENAALKTPSFKGLVSIGGHLPMSMVPMISARDKVRTPSLICHGRDSEALDTDAIDNLKTEFSDIREVKWKKFDDSMPKNREEMLPIMQFFADRLRAW